MNDTAKKAFIFDMDGVITDSEPWHDEALGIMLEKLGVPAERKSEPALGTGIGEFFAQLKRETGFKQNAETVTEEYFSAVSDLMRKNNVRECAHLKELLCFLKESGYILAVASSSAKSFVKNVLSYLGISEYFSVIVGGDEVPATKPEPYIYQKAVRLLGAKPENCFALEDSFNGSLSAKRAGVPCFGYRGTLSAQSTDFSNCFFVANNLNEIAEYIKNIK